MDENTVARVISTYFAIAAVILLSRYVFQGESSTIFLSLILLIPLYVRYRIHNKETVLSKEIDGTDKNAMLFWVFALFALALSVRILSVLLFGSAYEKTPLIYLTVLTIVMIEKTDLSVFGFKTQQIGKSLFCGLMFYAVLGGLTLLTYYTMVYVFTDQIPVQSYNITPFLLSMPFMTLCVGISEEGLFRGYMQTHFEKFYDPKQAILTQAILFGTWHFVWNLYPLDPFGMAQYVATTFFVGLAFGYLYNKTRNLVPVVFAHGLWNSVISGIVINSAAFNALQPISLSNQILLWALPYFVSLMMTLLFIKYLTNKFIFR